MPLPRSKPARPGPQTRTLGLETLEDRSLPSAGFSPSAVDHILVRFNQDDHAPVALAGTTLGRRIDDNGLYQVNLDRGTTADRALAEYRHDAHAHGAEIDQTLRVGRIPGNSRFDELWAMRNAGQDGGTPGADIHATQAWDVTTGSARTVVAVMDTGIDYDHPDLYQNVWLNQAEIPLSRLRHLVDYYHDGFISWRDLNDPRNQGVGKITDVNHDGRIDAADVLAPMVRDRYGRDTGYGGWAFPGNTRDGDTAHPNDFVGWNFVNNTNRPFDDNGHGTHVAGTIGATGAAGGVIGIDWRVQIMACKFLGAEGTGGLGNFVAALDYAIAHGARLSNNSWAASASSQILTDAVARARARGHLLIAAAGNDAANDDVNPSYPAGLPFDNVVAVAASDRHDRLASFSNYGVNRVDLAAPGVDILSTTPNNTYAYYSGTSMATPQVTGVAALVWGQHPSWSYQQVVAQVLRSVDRVAALQGKVRTGGRLDAARAVGTSPTPAPRPTPGTTSGRGVIPRVVASAASSPYADSLGSVRLTFNEPINVRTLGTADVGVIGPGGRALSVLAVRQVPNSGGRQFDVLFPTQTAPGYYYLRVGPEVRDAAGHRMQVYQATFLLAARPTFASRSPVAIRPGRVVSSLAVGPNLVVGDVAVKVTIRNAADRDLTLYLQAPDGTLVMLSNRLGGSGHEYRDTRFEDRAALSIRQGWAPFAGSFRPEGSLRSLAGRHAHGTWRLLVDDHGREGGVLVGWSLTITPEQGPSRIASRAEA